MVMIGSPLLLMAQSGVERAAFVHVGIAIPDMVAVTDASTRVRIPAIFMRVRKCVAGIKHPHAIHKHPDLAQRVELIACLRPGMARNGKDEVLVGGQVRKTAIEPWAHDLAAQS